MKIVLFLAKFSKTMVVLAIIAGIVSGAASAGLVALVHRALSSESPASASRFLWGIIALVLLLPVARFMSQWLLTKLSQTIVFEVRMRLCRQIMETPLRHLEEIGVGRIFSALTEDMYAVAITVLHVPMLFMNFAVLVGILTYLAWLSGTALVLVLVGMAIGVVSFQYAVRRARPYLQGARRDGDTLMGHFRALNDGAKELRLHYNRREAFVSKLLRSASSSLSRNNIVSNNILALANSWSQLVFFALICLVIFGLPQIQALDMRTITGYTLAMFYLLIPVETLVNIVPNLSRADVALKRIDALGLALEEKTSETKVCEEQTTPGWKQLALEGVVHAYRNEQDNSSFTLGPIDLTFRSGELVFLIGGNGSGKTTLIKLVSGLYVPEKGQLKLDGVPITDANRDYFRQHFSAVFSDFFLFESLLGLESKGLDQNARDYLVQLQLDHKVKVQEGVLSTINLSQGQRKRLALLTAFLEDRPIYIFDEWAADQDPFFRDVFYLNILPELKARGKTILVISHDDRYYHLGDRLIKLDYGQVEWDKRPVEDQWRVASASGVATVDMPAVP